MKRRGWEACWSIYFLKPLAEEVGNGIGADNRKVSTLRAFWEEERGILEKEEGTCECISCNLNFKFQIDTHTNRQNTFVLEFINWCVYYSCVYYSFCCIWFPCCVVQMDQECIGLQLLWESPIDEVVKLVTLKLLHEEVK